MLVWKIVVILQAEKFCKTKKLSMDGDYSERISQKGECYQDSESDILDAASEIARRVLEEIKTLAGTTSCKSVQLVRLRKWAEEQNCWFSDNSQFGDLSL